MSDDKHYRLYPDGVMLQIDDTDGNSVILHMDAVPYLVGDLLLLMDEADWPRLMAYLQNKAPALAHRLRQGVTEQETEQEQEEPTP